MQPSFGSGSPLLGGNAGSALAQVMAQQAQGGAGQTQQVTPAAPTFDPSAQPPTPPTGGAPNMAPSGGKPQTDSTMPFDSAEAKMIIQYLGNRLKSGAKFHGA